MIVLIATSIPIGIALGTIGGILAVSVIFCMMNSRRDGGS